jgi:hypothetical protein
VRCPATSGFSIEDYDPFHPQKVTEPASVEAMGNLCILNLELKMPTNQELAAFDDAEIQAIVVEHHRQRIRKLIDQIVRERRRILSTPGEAAKVATQREKPRLSAVEMERMQIEKLRKRHQREVEQMLATLMALSAIQAEAEERDRIDAERRRRTEEDRRRKREEAERDTSRGCARWSWKNGQSCRPTLRRGGANLSGRWPL